MLSVVCVCGSCMLCVVVLCFVSVLCFGICVVCVQCMFGASGTFVECLWYEYVGFLVYVCCMCCVWSFCVRKYECVVHV